MDSLLCSPLSGTQLSKPLHRREAEGQAGVVCHPLCERLPKITQNFLSLFYFFSFSLFFFWQSLSHKTLQDLPDALTSVFSSERVMLNHRFKVTHLIQMKRLRSSPRESDPGSGNKSVFHTPALDLGDKRHRGYPEAPGDGGYFVLTANTLLLPKYQIVINNDVLATRTSLGMASTFVTSILTKAGPAAPQEMPMNLPRGQKVKKVKLRGRKTKIRWKP